MIMHDPVKKLLSGMLIASLMAPGLPAWAETLALIDPVTEQAMIQPSAAITRGVLEITVTPVPLTAKLLQQKYQGVHIRVTNPTDQPVTLVSAAMENGVNGDTAYEEAHKTLLGWTSLLGVSGLLLTTVRRGSRNSKARAESRFFDSQLPTGELGPHQSVETQTLLPLNETGMLELHYRHPTSGEELTHQQVLPSS